MFLNSILKSLDKVPDSYEVCQTNDHEWIIEHLDWCKIRCYI